MVCSVCKPVHAADKLLLFTYLLIERQNTQIDSAVLGDLQADAHMHTLGYLDWGNLQEVHVEDRDKLSNLPLESDDIPLWCNEMKFTVSS